MQQGAVTASDSNCSSNKVKIRTFFFYLKKAIQPMSLQLSNPISPRFKTNQN